MSATSTNRVWLSREGKTEGPFTPDQIQALKDSGEYSMYAWQWDEGGKTWKPIHPMPTAPVEAEEVTGEIAVPSSSAPMPIPQTGLVTLKRPLSAVCHDNRNIIGGTLDSVMGADGMFKSSDHPDGFPPFRKGHQLSVNLLDEASGKSENAQAEIVELKKAGNLWEFRLKWKKAPALLS